MLVSVLLVGDVFFVVEDVMVFNGYAKIRWLSEGIVPLFKITYMQCNYCVLTELFAFNGNETKKCVSVCFNFKVFTLNAIK